MNTKEEIARLRAEIRRHDRLYYALADPRISDREYDALLARLRAIEKANPELDDPDSPTRRIGDALTEGFRTIHHRIPMLSIANTYNPEELAEFDRRVRQGLGAGEEGLAYYVEPKIDGVAIGLAYEDGRFELAATRGNGEEGDDISANARTMRSMPLLLEGAPAGRLELRGEVYLTRDDLLRLNHQRIKRGLAPFANPRNLAAGTLKMLDPSVVARRGLRLFIHGIVESDRLGLETHGEALAACRAWGLPVVPLGERHEDITSVQASLGRWNERWAELPYDIDGLVIKVDDLNAWDRLGVTRKDVRWAIAYKFKIEVAETEVLEIGLQVGRTGRVTPVASLAPAELGGTTVRRASLHNEEEVARLDVRVGDRVQVVKGGEIIPKIVRVVLEGRPEDALPFEMPAGCPVCDSALERYEGVVGSWCENVHCSAQVRSAIQHFAGRGAMDIGGLGKALIEQLVDRGWVGDVGDLYRLDAERIAGLERMGELSAANLIEQIETSKGRSLERLVLGLGIRHVGRSAARILAARFGDLDTLLNQEEAHLEEIDEIGPTIAESVVRFAARPTSRRVVEKLRVASVDFGVAKMPGAAPAQSPFDGKRVVVTGTIEGIGREEAKELIVRAGGRPTSSVSAKTDLVVHGDGAGSKLAKALELNVATMDGAGFRAALSRLSLIPS